MVLLRSTIGVMLLALCSLLAMPNAFAAEGEISFCNEFPHKVYVAIAYLQTDVNNYLSRGWLNIETGKCYVFDTALRLSTFYYYAESEPYKDGKKKVKTSWGKGKQFAVRDAHFQSYNAEQKYSGMYFVEFSQGPEASGGALTTTITFLEDGRSMTTIPAPNKGDGKAEAPTPPPSPDREAAPASPSTGGEDSPKN
jgi:uncharacterized membrane protein